MIPPAGLSYLIDTIQEKAIKEKIRNRGVISAAIKQNASTRTNQLLEEVNLVDRLNSIEQNIELSMQIKKPPVTGILLFN
ncbi:hypothetical protein [Paenibacillus sp. UMB4589-SE434]|uniref:hypothetical protein n=1 Tax=Paenibacillus sp. UMB4589-SE434 TaxID=3046314 RepID=UPI00254DA1C5|nr:hypothetical protein [Paenibacillus sp. UMB4589-SE434]MDK8182148.1 hypothetical protein [Paenibacillus sp. UMB4589-SE434]